MRTVSGHTWAALLLIAAARPGLGAFNDGAAGTTTAQFLELGASARASGMGEAAVAASWDATAVRTNPAAMLRVEENSASFMHAEHLKGAFLDHLAYVRRSSAENALGLSLLYMNYGSIQKTDEFATPIGTARPTDLALTGAFARQFGGHAFGLSLSYIQSKIVDSAQTAAASVGILSRPYGMNRVRAALVVENLGGTMKFDRKADPLPLTVRGGVAGYLRPDWLATAELVAPRDAGLYGAVGTEKWFGSPFDRGLALRAGYNTRSLGDLNGLTGVSAGLGFAFSAFMLDYAFVPFGELGWTHRVSLSMRFGIGGSEAASASPVTDAETSVSTAPLAALAAVSGPPTPVDLYPEQMQRFLVLLKAKDLEGARGVLEAASQGLPAEDARRVYVYERLGAVAVREKDFAKAKASYIRAIEFAKKNGVKNEHLVNAYLGLAWCLSVQGQARSAIKNYKKAGELTESAETRKRIDAKLTELKGKRK